MFICQKAPKLIKTEKDYDLNAWTSRYIQINLKPNSGSFWYKDYRLLLFDTVLR